MPEDNVRRVIDAVWRIEAPKLIARLARMVRDVGLAEDFAQDALVSALEKWPASGVPENPAAWLMTAAKNNAVDHFRRHANLQRKTEQLVQEVMTEGPGPDIEAAMDDDFGDDLLRLIFVACHPVLQEEARVALTLRLLGGLTTPEIARAFLVPEPTVAQRIVRAKRTLAKARVPFEVPAGQERIERLASVLEVIYLIFNEGYSPAAGDRWVRNDLCEEALRLGRVLAELLPGESEVHGLVSLIEFQSSRLRARLGPGGEPVLLLDQDRSRWDRLLIRRGFRGLERAKAVRPVLTMPAKAGIQLRRRHKPGPGKAEPSKMGPSKHGPYVIQAEIASRHAAALEAGATDWARIAELYGQLGEVQPSPVVELNRAVAVGMAYGPAEGLELVDALVGEPSLAGYHLLPSVRGDLLFKLGRLDEARAEFERAAALTQNERERALLLGRAEECRRASKTKSQQ